MAKMIHYQGELIRSNPKDAKRLEYSTTYEKP